MVRIVIAGVGGRMGREILAVARTDPAVRVVAGTERQGTTPTFDGSFGPECPVVDDLETIAGEFDVLVDFTNPAATLTHARWCANQGMRLVAGTTGLTAQQLAELQTCAAKTAIFYARNMSIGLSSLLTLLPALAQSLDGYDVEIVETHHRHKADAPSGTAVALAEAITAATARSLDERAVYGRHGISPRTPGEIGIHSVRGGGNAGEHTIIFGDEGEEIRVTHRAFSRRTFAIGAVRAALFLAGKPAGLYSMADLKA